MTAEYDGVLRPRPGDPALLEAFLPVAGQPDNHAAQLLTVGGDLLCAWFSGSGEGNPDTHVVCARLASGARGWSHPVALSADPGRSEQNPVLFADPRGRLWLLHTSNEPHDQSTAHVVVRTSDDGGHAWGPPDVLPAAPGLFLRHPPLLLPGGPWVLPAYRCVPGGHYSVMLLSEDGGRSWTEAEVPESRHRVQACLAARPDGTLLALFRSRAADRIFASLSADGRAWSPPVRTSLPNNNSSFQLCAAPGGRLMLAYNDASLERDQFRWVPGSGGPRRKPLRTPLTLAASDDGGHTWPHRRNLRQADAEHRESGDQGYAYPSATCGPDGALHVAFSYLHRTICHVRLDPAWVEGGDGPPLGDPALLGSPSGPKGPRPERNGG